MPNRILRDWCESEKVNKVDVYTERFFTRLIMNVDDYGRYKHNVTLLRSRLYPLLTDVRESDISRWLDACEAAGLILLYEVDGSRYLQIENFGQTLRQRRQKYPPPKTCVADDEQVMSNGVADAHLKRNESETESETISKAREVYLKPIDFLKQNYEIGLQQLCAKSRLPAADFEFCLQQWSLRVQFDRWQYSDNVGADVQSLAAGFTKWLNSWQRRERDGGPQKQIQKQSHGEETQSEHGTITLHETGE